MPDFDDLTFECIPATQRLRQVFDLDLELGDVHRIEILEVRARRRVVVLADGLDDVVCRVLRRGQLALALAQVMFEFELLFRREMSRLLQAEKSGVISDSKDGNSGGRVLRSQKWRSCSMPEKRSIFLCHSSRDRAFMLRMKDYLTEIVGGYVDFFLSSDGESIRDGYRWITEIEDGLKRSDLALIFVTKNALLHSWHWISYEAGFMRASKKEVVPIALFDTEFSEIPAPINSFQGFEIRDHRGLQNIPVKFNQWFKAKASKEFTEGEFLQLRALYYANSPERSWHTIAAYTRMTIWIPYLTGSIECAILDHCSPIVQDYSPVRTDQLLLLTGMKIGFKVPHTDPAEYGTPAEVGLLMVEVSRYAAHYYAGLINSLISSFKSLAPRGFECRASYKSLHALDGSDSEYSGKFVGTEVQLIGAGTYRFRDLTFSFDQMRSKSDGVWQHAGFDIKLEPAVPHFDIDGIDALCAQLSELGVIISTD